MASRTLPATDRSVSIGRVISRAFSAIGAVPGTILAVYVVFGTVPLIAYHYLEQSLGTVPGLFWERLLVTLIVGPIIGYVAQGFLAPAVVAHADGARANFRLSVVAALRAIVPLIAVSVAVTLGFAAGLMLLVVPGVIIHLMWSQAVCLTVTERLGVMAALRRSRYLTSGARWKIFGLGLVESIAFGAAALMLHLVMRGFGGDTNLITGPRVTSIGPWLVANVIQTTVLGAVGHAIAASLYVELRDWKDGMSTDRLATVFA